MERGKENEEQSQGEENKSLVSSIVLHEDIANLLDFIERLRNGPVRMSFAMNNIEYLTLRMIFVCTFCHFYYSFFLESCNDKMSCISNEIHDLVQSLLHRSGEHMLFNLKHHQSGVSLLVKYIRRYIRSHKYPMTMTEDAILMFLEYLPKCCSKLIFPSMTRYELLQNVFGNLRDFQRLNVNGSVKCEAVVYVLSQIQLVAQGVVNFCFTLLDYQLHEDVESHVSRANPKLAKLLVEAILVELEVMHICSTNLKASKSEEVGSFIKQLLEASPNILRESLIYLQEYMVNVVTPSSSATNIHAMIEFLLIILTDVPKDIIHHDKLFVLMTRVEALTKEVFVLVSNLEENMNATSSAGLNLLEKIELLKEDLKNVFLKAGTDSSQLCFPMSDGSLFMNLLLRHLNDLLDSNAYSVALIIEEIRRVKEDLELITLFFGKVEQELNRDLWARVLDMAYAAEHAINSIIVRDHGLLQLIFSLPDTVEKIKLVKKEVKEKISKNTSIVFANSPNKPVENRSSTADKIIVGFEEERKSIIGKLTSPAEIDVISIVGMPGLGKTTLADRVYNEKCIIDHFDVRAWCTVDQECNEKKLLQKIYNQVIGLKGRFSEDDIDDDIDDDIEDDIDDDVADKLRKQLFGKRYLIVLDDLWDTATWDEITRPFPSEFQKGSRVILTTRKKEVALHAKCYSDPLALRLLTPEESWVLLEKRIFREKSCPDELKDVGEKIARECDGLPLVLDLIGGVIALKEKKEALWLEVLNNLSSFIFKDDEKVMKIVQLSYDHLSDHLKPCLIYLASFPKDEYIAISELKHLWSAEGLMEQTEMKVYMDELISSSLVLVSSDRGASPICQIHDLVHDFCSRTARKEKLFVLTSPSALSSSSSDLMPRRMAVHYDQRFPSSDVNFVLLDAEKENPYVKHLLSLKVYFDESPLRYKCHLRHLRLLKSLELRNITLTDSLLNEIGMLVHLKFLHIRTEAKALPPSFSNLRNLETLVVDSQMVVSPVIWSLAKLRDVSMQRCSLFDPCINEPIVLDEDLKLENLRTLYHLYLPSSEDTEDIFKRFPNLQILRVKIKQLLNRSAEKICFPRFDVLNELEELRVHVPWYSFSAYTYEFPSSLKKVDLEGINLTSDSLSRIASLPNLQKLCLRKMDIEGETEWNMEEVTFQNLISLKLTCMYFSKWQVDGEKSFPVLEELKIEYCKELIEIPESFGDIASLKSISVEGSPQLKESALNIQQYVADMTGEDKLEVLGCS